MNNNIYITTNIYITNRIMNKSKTGFYIGRFQPLHYGHINIIEKGLREMDEFIVIIGSINKSDHKNPLSFETRKKSIEQQFNTSKLKVLGLKDYDADTWFIKLEELLYKSTKNTLYMYYCIKNDDIYTKQYIDEMKMKLNIKHYIFVSEYTLNDDIINSTDIRNKITSFVEDIQKYIPLNTLQLFIKDM